jgi:hypothetical protein
MNISVNDIQFNLEKCHHCHKEPSEKDAMEALAYYERTVGQPTCAACGKPVKPKVITVCHQLLADGTIGWYADVDDDPTRLFVRPALTMIVRNHDYIHRECALRVLPYLNPKTLNVVRESEDLPSLWSTQIKRPKRPQ